MALLNPQEYNELIEENKDELYPVKHENLLLYCAYHNRDNRFIIKEEHNYYEPLIESNWFKPYSLVDNHNTVYDELSNIFNEWACIANFVNLEYKCDYIGSCTYKRQWIRKYIREHGLDKDFIYQDISYEFSFDEIMKYRFNNFLYPDFKMFLEDTYPEESIISRTFLINSYNVMPCILHNCFICEYYKILPIIDVIGHFFNYINYKYKLNWLPEMWLEFIKINFTDKYRWKLDNKGDFWYHRESNAYKVLIYMVEMMIGFYLGQVKIDNDYD